MVSSVLNKKTDNNNTKTCMRFVSYNKPKSASQQMSEQVLMLCDSTCRLHASVLLLIRAGSQSQTRTEAFCCKISDWMYHVLNITWTNSIQFWNWFLDQIEILTFSKNHGKAPQWSKWKLRNDDRNQFNQHKVTIQGVQPVDVRQLYTLTDWQVTDQFLLYQFHQEMAMTPDQSSQGGYHSPAMMYK